METQRYPVSVRLVGVMHKEKRKMYLASVLWSDQNEIVVYRTFRSFQKLHKQMKKAFPPESKLKKSSRLIPKFRYRREKTSAQTKSLARSLVRLKFLQKYCNDLLSCDPRVCQCTELVQFFHPTQQDLQPEFSNNSIMVTPPAEEPKTNLGGGNVTKPFVTETYRCVAAYETKDTKNKPFKVVPDETIDVLIKDKGGWWLVENDEKRMAWFPAPFLEKLEDDSDDESGGFAERGKFYTAIKNYTATKSDEITVSIGASVQVLQESDNGWWFVRHKESAGYIPSIYLRSNNYPHIHLTPSLPDHQNFGRHSLQFSRSQENLLVLSSSRPSSPHLLKPESKQMSRSLNALGAHPPTSTAMVPRFNVNDSNAPPHHHPLPTITIQTEESDQDRSPGNDDDGSFDSESEFSLSDDLSMSSRSSSPSLSLTEDQLRLRLSLTPQPPSGPHLSPSAGARMMPSVSDPNLYRSQASPKVPPRPNPQQILTRCTTVTRKNAEKGSGTPALTETLCP